MSQWGAYGLSLQGKGYAAILRHYYPGAKLDLYQAPSAWPKPPPQP
jgi:peptidoglycan hydrolase-like amidase